MSDCYYFLDIPNIIEKQVFNRESFIKAIDTVLDRRIQEKKETPIKTIGNKDPKTATPNNKELSFEEKEAKIFDTLPSLKEALKKGDIIIGLAMGSHTGYLQTFKGDLNIDINFDEMGKDLDPLSIKRGYKIVASTENITVIHSKKENRIQLKIKDNTFDSRRGSYLDLSINTELFPSEGSEVTSFLIDIVPTIKKLQEDFYNKKNLKTRDIRNNLTPEKKEEYIKELGEYILENLPNSISRPSTNIPQSYQEQTLNKLREVTAQAKALRENPDNKGKFKGVTTMINGDSQIEPNPNMFQATIIGNKVDDLVRDFFQGKELKYKDQNLTSNMDDFNAFVEGLESLKKEFEAKGELPFTEEFTLYQENYDGKGTILNGKTDLLTIDKIGQIRVYDMKTLTPKANNSYEYNFNGKESTREKHQKQISAYSIMLKNAGFSVAGGGIIPIIIEREVNPDISSYEDAKEILGLEKEEFYSYTKASEKDYAIQYEGEIREIELLDTVGELITKSNSNIRTNSPIGTTENNNFVDYRVLNTLPDIHKC